VTKENHSVGFVTETTTSEIPDWSCVFRQMNSLYIFMWVIFLVVVNEVIDKVIFTRTIGAINKNDFGCAHFETSGWLKEKKTYRKKYKRPPKVSCIITCYSETVDRQY
jgi:hypothetical protein